MIFLGPDIANSNLKRCDNFSWDITDFRIGPAIFYSTWVPLKKVFKIKSRHKERKGVGLGEIHNGIISFLKYGFN